ncbi:transcriptional regulator of acetoin/glycerol metabolism [Antricoccus suffuscus]|uniref:Transcriptional regulator of acetoin/glycerol metabolism n=1 Tax=Antricoccus suffuscus TaxID=1629062 RepID=A0A2T0ZZD6_9ACTN|nr:helix-turn-helix domain-containing protein [Antricoccus suffuscus]PRZ41713.1 transcriptional regulator of acetoin/glycerol metabolism [Antricoccus suffuscus]
MPETIVRSWRRSLASAVPHDGEVRVRYVNNIDPESLLIRAATPVLDRLEHDLADVNVAMVLSDQSGQIILRRTRDRTQTRKFDRASAAQGFDYSELSIGTNGLGTVLEEKKPVFVRGAEHYSELLADLSCAGVPIKSPISGRVLGAFSFACSIGATSPLMSALTLDAGRQIESRLLSLASESEQHLMRIYTARERRHRGPLVVLSRRTILANSLGLAYINTETHAQLWEMLSGHDWVGTLPLTLQTAVGEVGCVAERVDGVGQSAYYSLEIMPQAALPRFQVSRGDSSGGEARHHRLPHVEEQLRQVAQMGENLALCGPTGAGKLHIARDFVEQHLGATAPMTLDVTAFALGDGASWFKDASGRLAGGGTLVLRHLQDLPSTDVTKVRHLAETASSGDGRLVVTADPDSAPAHVGALIGQIATVVEIPALAAMREDIVPFVRAMVAGFPEPLNAMTLSSQAMQALMRWTWPGNLAELHRTLLALAQRKRGGLVQLTDLPVQLVESVQARQRTPIENAEREAIVAALASANGNRSEAARSLGIGRTTLYRKIRVHHIDESEALAD